MTAASAPHIGNAHSCGSIAAGGEKTPLWNFAVTFVLWDLTAAAAAAAAAESTSKAPILGYSCL